MKILIFAVKFAVGKAGLTKVLSLSRSWRCIGSLFYPVNAWLKCFVSIRRTN